MLGDEPAGGARRARQGDLLTEHRAHAQLGRAGGAGDATARRRAHGIAKQRVVVERRAHRGRVYVEIEQRPQQRDRGGLVTRIREGQRDVQGIVACAEPHLHNRRTAGQGEAADIASGPGLDMLDPGDRAAGEVVQQRRGVERAQEGEIHAYSVAMHKVPSDFDHLTRLLGELPGLDIVDVGCGEGKFVGALAAAGARVTGVEVSDDKVAQARDVARVTGAEIVLGRGEALPMPDDSMDVVVYLRALHHVPIGAMAEALSEARRVLRTGGVLYVVEPLPTGDFYELVSLVEDETEVRAAAQAALAGASEAGFTHEHGERYDTIAVLRSLDDLRERIVGVDPERGPVFDGRRAELERRFRAAGRAAGSGRVFEQPQQVDVLRASSLVGLANH